MCGMDNPAPAVANLTDKEREALRLWLGHATAKEIALDLGVSHHAVEKRLKSARQKLGVQTSLEAARILAGAERYGQAAYQSPEVALPTHAPQIDDVGGMARRKVWITAGVIIMVLTTLSALVLAGFSSAQAPAQDDARQLERQLEGVFIVDRRDGETSAAKINLRKSFENMDKDSSGYIEEGEIRQVTVIPVGADVSNLTGTQMSGFMENADTDGDGRVSFAEYEKLLSGWLSKAGWDTSSPAD